ncbi:MAG: ATP-binding protein, partial [Chitinophagaceae bacterium]
VKESPGINRVLFSIAPGDTQKLYIKIYNKFSDPSPMPVIELRNTAIPVPILEATAELAAAGAVMLILCILSIFFFFFVRDRSYLYFGCYLFCLFLHYQILKPDVPIIDWLFPEYPSLVEYVWHSLTMGSFIFFLLFGRSFIMLHRLSKKIDTALKYFIALWTFMLVLDLVLMATANITIVFPYVFFSLFSIALGFLVRIAFFKNILARIYIIGAFWLIIFSIIGGLWSQQIINPPFNPWLLAQYGEVLIYCFGLAYKLRLNEKAKAEADHIKELDEIKSRFFANISHEFRTPLTLIRGPLQQIEEEAGKSNKSADATVSVQWRKIKTMRRHTERLLELVNQLLDLSRLDSGKMKLQVAKGDAIQLLKTLAASFESMAERKQIHYQVHFPENTHLCYFDRDKLEKIVTNLLGNAFKYTPEKGIVSMIVETDEKRLRLSVEDSGSGIGKKELDKVFDRFYQAEGNEDKGTGIGLALVKELTDLYRGQISVSSEPGKGSRFRISLPVDFESFSKEELLYTHAETENELFVPDDQQEVAAGATIVADNGLPILLIVEDNTDLRNHMKEIVQDHYQVLQAVNGKEGLEKAIEEIPDLIISDVMMPLMDGFTLAQKLKKDERTSHIPIILLTAKAGQAHKIEGLETGADDYLTKPFDHQELLAR